MSGNQYFLKDFFEVLSWHIGEIPRKGDGIIDCYLRTELNGSTGRFDFANNFGYLLALVAKSPDVFKLMDQSYRLELEDPEKFLEFRFPWHSAFLLEKVTVPPGVTVKILNLCGKQ